MAGPTVEELRGRIRGSAAYHGGPLPREAAIAWHGYLAALVEWGLLSAGDHAALTDMLPRVEDDPILQIPLGWETPDDQPEWIARRDDRG